MLNLRILYELISIHGPVGVSALVELSGHTASTCSRLLEELMSSGLIRDSGLGQSSGGRRPVLYEINYNSHFAIGIDISPLHITFVLVNLKLDILEKDMLKVGKSTSSMDIIQFLCDKINASIHDNGIEDSQLLGIGLGDNSLEIQHSGFIDSNKAADIHHSSRTIVFSDIEQQIRENFDVLIRTEKGTSLAALGEYRKHYKNISKNLIYTLCGVEIKCGIIIQGNLYEQQHSIQNTLGHTVINTQGRKCYCGKYGCLEAYSSIPVIREEIIRQLKRNKPSFLNEMVHDLEDITSEHILEALRQGDQVCISVVEEAAYDYGVGLSNVINVLQPDIVVLGGILSMEPVFFEKAVESIKQNIVYNHNHKVQIVKPASGYNSIAIGAASLLMNF